MERSPMVASAKESKVYGQSSDIVQLTRFPTLIWIWCNYWYLRRKQRIPGFYAIPESLVNSILKKFTAFFIRNFSGSMGSKNLFYFYIIFINVFDVFFIIFIACFWCKSNHFHLWKLTRSLMILKNINESVRFTIKNLIFLISFTWRNDDNFYVKVSAFMAWFWCKNNHFHLWKLRKSLITSKNIKESVRFTIKNLIFLISVIIFLWTTFHFFDVKYIIFFHFLASWAG